MPGSGTLVPALPCFGTESDSDGGGTATPGLRGLLGASEFPFMDPSAVQPVCSPSLIWILFCQLGEWEIDFLIVKQEGGAVLGTATGDYHQGWNGGANVAEAVDYAGSSAAVAPASYRPRVQGCWADP